MGAPRELGHPGVRFLTDFGPFLGSILEPKWLQKVTKIGTVFRDAFLEDFGPKIGHFWDTFCTLFEKIMEKADM